MARTGELYIFGDSLSDDGATAVQLGEEPIDLYFRGRASNGILWHEHIRNDLAVAPAATSISPAPDSDGYLSGSDLNGINFAHAGAVSSSTEDPALPGALQQAQGFAALVASGDIEAPDDQDVFMIWIGGNDFLKFADATVLDLFNILTLGSSIVENIENTVETLTVAGARNFLFLGQPSIGGAFLGELAPSGTFLARLWNDLAESFNDKLSDYVKDLNKVDGHSALFVDIASLVEDIEDDPDSFGFSNVTSDIFSDNAPLDDQSYFSVDGVHPTGAGHAVIARYVMDVAAAAGFDLTTLAGNVLPGSARNDTLTGTGGDDSITGNAGDDVINGNAGADTAFMSGSDTVYTLSLGATIRLTDRSGVDGSDLLSGIETLDFGGVGFDLTRHDDAASLSAHKFRMLTEVYVSYFDRAPDALGLTFWADAFATGASLTQIAQDFALSDEALAVFPPDLPDGDFVHAVYLNTLGRAADDAGFAFWSDALATGGVSRAQFVLAVLDGTRAAAPDTAPADFGAQQAADRAYLDSKVDIGLYFSAILGMSDVADAEEVMALFDGSTDSISAAVSMADAHFAEAMALDGSGQFLVDLVGVVEDPFLV
jgi:phospholipase/lecithinase/hemolysin